MLLMLISTSTHSVTDNIVKSAEIYLQFSTWSAYCWSSVSKDVWFLFVSDVIYHLNIITLFIIKWIVCSLALYLDTVESAYNELEGTKINNVLQPECAIYKNKSKTNSSIWM